MKIDDVLASDIRAYINGYEIPSMNINGYTAIIVEDLRKYGFDIIWGPNNRKLIINENVDKAIDPINAVSKDEIIISQKIKDVLYTDNHRYVSWNFEMKDLSTNLKMLNFKSKHYIDNKLIVYSLRSFIWRKEDKNWRILFHQGTPIKDNEASK